MPTPPQRASSFSYQKRYKQVVWIAGREAEDFSFNEMQEIIDIERKRLGENIFAEGAIVAGLSPALLSDAGSIFDYLISDGLVWLRGRLEPVAGGAYSFPNSPPLSGFVQWTLTQIDQIADPTLADPNTGNPIDERLQVTAVLSMLSVNPDAVDMDFSKWVLESNPTTAVYLDQPGIVPYSKSLGAWTLSSGNVGIGSPYWGTNGLRFKHTNGTEDLVTVQASFVPNTQYTCYLAFRTVYQQTDLAQANGVFVSIGRTSSASPLVTSFATVGGTTLLGDMTIGEFTFTSDNNGAPMAIGIGLPAGAATTEIDVGMLLITAVPLPVNVKDRHYINVLSGVPLASTVLPVTTLPIAALGVSFAAYEDITGVVSPDITPNVQDAVKQLADNREPIRWCGTAGGAANVYTVIPPVVPVAYTTDYPDGLTLRFRVPANTTNTGSSTLSAGAPGARPIVRLDNSNVLPGDLTAGEILTVTYDQVNQAWVIPIQPFQPTFAGFRNLMGDASGGGIMFGIKADQAILRNPVNNRTVILSGVAVSVNISEPLAGFIPSTGSRDQSAVFADGPGSFINIFMIAQAGGANPSALASLAAPTVGPTLPTGYLYWAFVGTIALDYSGSIISSRIRGNRVSYDTQQSVLPNPIAINDTAQHAADMSDFIPPTAISAIVNTVLHDVSGGGSIDINISLSLISGGGTYIQQDIRLQMSQQEKGSLYAEIPILNQSDPTLYYTLNNIAGTTDFYMWAIAFTVPNGAN